MKKTTDEKKEIEKLEKKCQINTGKIIFEKGFYYAIKELAKGVSLPEMFWDRIDKIMLEVQLSGIQQERQRCLDLIDEFFNERLDECQEELKELKQKLEEK
jgi:hypothetical protein